MVIVIDKKPSSSIDINEFFHSMELEFQSLCYEFKYDILLCDHQALLEEEGSDNSKEKSEKIKEFLEKVRKKIEELFQKAKEKLQEIQIKFMDIISRIEKKILNTIRDKEKVERVTSEVAEEYFKTHQYYKFSEDGAFKDMQLNAAQFKFYNDEDTSKVNSVSNMMKIYECDFSNTDEKQEIVSMFSELASGKRNIVENRIGKDIRRLKTWKEDVIRWTINNDQDSDELKSFFIQQRTNMYIAHLKMICTNTQSRFNIFSTVLKKIKSEGKGDE